MKRIESDYIEDIIASIGHISDFIDETNYEQFIQDRKTVFAVIRALEIIGEAAKSVSTTLQEKYPDVPWKLMAGMRDKLIHAYFGVRLELVWNTIHQLLPPLKLKFEMIIEELREERESEEDTE